MEVLYENADPSDFLYLSVSERLKFYILYPWYIAIDPIRDYFGEKYAIYFSLFSYYNKSKFLMAFVGLITYIIKETFLAKHMVW